MHPEIIKFWSGEGVSFFEQECVPPTPDLMGYLNGYYHSLYCRAFGGKHIVIAKTKHYLQGHKPFNIKYETFYLDDKKYIKYSEEEILRIIKLKAFI